MFSNYLYEDRQHLPKQKINLTKSFYQEVNALSQQWAAKKQAAKEKEQVAVAQMFEKISEEERHDFEERQSMSYDKPDDDKTIDGSILIKEVKP